MSKVIEVVNLYKKYKQSPHFALKDLSFSVEKGEIFGMLGTNGAGKTTLMSILMGEITPTAGEFSICGLSFKGQANQIRYRMGWCLRNMHSILPLQQGKIFAILLVSMVFGENICKILFLKDLKGWRFHRWLIERSSTSLGG